MMFLNPLIQDGEFHRDEDLVAAGLQLTRNLMMVLDLGRLSKKMCPYLQRDGAVVIFVLRAYAHSDQAQALETLLRKRGYSLAAPARRIVSPTLLLSLVRSQVSCLEKSSAGQSVQRPKQETAIVGAFQDIVEWAVRQGASDIHLNLMSGANSSSVYYSIQGRYVCPARFRHIQNATLMDIVSVAWMSIQGGNGAVFDPLLEQQGRLQRIVDGKVVVLRWASLATDLGASVCLRVLANTESEVALDLETLGYLPSQREQLNRARLSEGGAVLLAGVVGSGKSTTLACLMRMLPAYRKLITLEDPVEYRIPNALQNSVVRRLDEPDANAFDAKLKTVKRSAMSDLLIGEIRDAETGRAFMDLVSSGTNLYSTVHASSALLIIERLASSFIAVPRDFLATPGLLKLLVYQALVPQLCSGCALPLSCLKEGDKDALGVTRDALFWKQYAARLERLYHIDVEAVRVHNPLGCDLCHQADLLEFNGWRGRTVVSEIIEPNLDSYLLSLIRQGDAVAVRDYFFQLPKTAISDAQMNNKSAMECALYKVSQGLVDPREVELRFRSFETDELWRSKPHRCVV